MKKEIPQKPESFPSLLQSAENQRRIKRNDQESIWFNTSGRFLLKPEIEIITDSTGMASRSSAG